MHQTLNACLAIIYRAKSIVELSALKRSIPFQDIHLSSDIWEHPRVLHCPKHFSASIHVEKCRKPKLSEAQTMWICLCNHPWKSHKARKQSNLDSGLRIQFTLYICLIRGQICSLTASMQISRIPVFNLGECAFLGHQSTNNSSKSSMHIWDRDLFAHRKTHVPIGINRPTMFKYHPCITVHSKSQVPLFAC